MTPPKEVDVCRWLGYRGSPIRPHELLYDTERSLIEQSRRHTPNLPLPNGDGTGLGWYARRPVPALYRSTAPAWGDQNLHELANEVESPMFLAHVRAATSGTVQETNCHPFRFQNWLFVHNGYVADFATIRRELLLQVRPELFENIKGSTDSELMFHLALGFGLVDDPIGSLEQMAGLVESVGAAAGVTDVLQMTVGITDGQTLWAARYASGSVVNTLYVSEDVDAVRMLYPEQERLQHFSDDARVVVSEPLVELPGLWREVSPSSALTVTDTVREQPFTPRQPA